jgi:hypothetical protein
VDLTPEEIAHCRLVAEIEAGLKIPYFVQVEDGYYTEELIIDHPPECVLIEVTRLDESVPTYVHGRRAPCCKPRYRWELRYRDA